MWSDSKKNDATQWSDSYRVESDSWISRDDVFDINGYVLLHVKLSQAWEMVIAHAIPKDSINMYKPTERSLSLAWGYWESAENSNKGIGVRVKARDSGQCWGESWRMWICTMISLIRFLVNVPVVDLTTERWHIREVYSI